MNFKITFQNDKDIPTDFINEFLNISNPTYFVIFINVFKRVFNGEKSISNLDISMDIDFATENDVYACFKYYEKKGALSISEDTVYFLPIGKSEMSSTEIEIQEDVIDVIPSIEINTKPTYSMAEIENYRNIDKNFNNVYILADKYLGRTLKTSDMYIIMDIYDRLGLPADVIEYLIEYHAQKGITNLNYMEMAAADWHNKGVKTREDAINITNNKNEDYMQIRKALGMTNKGAITSAEEKMLNKFYNEYGFSLTMILEACDTCVISAKSGGPSLSYLDGILKNWNNDGIRTLEDIKNRQDTIDALNEKKSARKQKNNSSKASFNNLPVENSNSKDDYKDIEKKNLELLRKNLEG